MNRFLFVSMAAALLPFLPTAASAQLKVTATAEVTAPADQGKPPIRQTEGIGIVNLTTSSTHKVEVTGAPANTVFYVSYAFAGANGQGEIVGTNGETTDENGKWSYSRDFSGPIGYTASSWRRASATSDIDCSYGNATETDINNFKTPDA